MRFTLPRKPLARRCARTSLLSPWKSRPPLGYALGHPAQSAEFGVSTPTPLNPPLPRGDTEGSKVSTCCAGNAVTCESGRLPTQVSIGRPLAVVILISVFFGGADSADTTDCFGFLTGFSFFFDLLTMRPF